MMSNAIREWLACALSSAADWIDADRVDSRSRDEIGLRVLGEIATGKIPPEAAARCAYAALY